MRSILRKNVFSRFNYWEVAFMLALTLVIAMHSPLIQNGDSGTDSSVFKYMAEVIARGGMPYRDSFDHKGPLIYIINWLGRCISFWRGVWVVEFVAIFITVIALYKIIRFSCSTKMALLILVITLTPIFEYFEGGNLVEEYSMPFISIALYIFIDYFRSSIVNKKRLILCGFCFAGILMLRPNMIALWVVFCIAVLIECILKKKYKEVGFFLTYFLVGMFILITPILIWLIVNKGFNAFINNYLLFNMLYSSVNLSAKSTAFFSYLSNGLVSIAFLMSIFQVCLKKSGSKSIVGVTFV